MFFSKETRRSKLAIVMNRGRNHFIFVKGALLWGGTTALLYVFLMWYFVPNNEGYSSLPFSLILFSIAGIIWGYLAWRSAEKQFKKDGKEDK